MNSIGKTELIMDSSSDEEINQLLRDYNQSFVISDTLNSNKDHQCVNSSNNPLETGHLETKKIEFIGTPASLSKNNTKIEVISQYVRNKITPNPSEQSNKHVKVHSTNYKLKDSTNKLLSLLEELRTKTIPKLEADNVPPVYTPKIAHPIKPLYTPGEFSPIPEIADTEACAAFELDQLESQTRELSSIHIEDEHDDCSIYKRLTRKCHCLNKQEYNDFIIHFNDNPHYATTNIGEVIKNVKILKKFLNMGHNYTKNTLMFLIQGFQESSYSEKVEITQACAHADICSVFDDKSIVVYCILWPIKYEYYGDAVTQNYASTFINQLAQIEEGRRYLNYTSRLKSDIKKIIRRKNHNLEPDVVDSLEHTLKLLEPSISEDKDCTYYYNRLDEGFGYRTIQHLSQYRHYMTLDEILTHLDLLKKFSIEAKGNAELRFQIQSLLALFVMILNEYNNSEMNILIAAIVNNIVSEQVLIHNTPKTVTYASMATEAIKMRTQTSQMPDKKSAIKKSKTPKSKAFLDFAQSKFNRKDLGQVIMVPLEKQTRNVPLKSILRSTNL